MRRTLGWILFIVGLIALCWWAAGHQAKTIEAQVTSEADQLTAELNESLPSTELTDTVSGRDIVVTGVAPADQLDAIKQQYIDLAGRRVVNTDALVGIESASPYVFGAIKTEDGTTAQGYAPTAASLEALSSEFANASSAEFDLAAGAPDGWDNAVMTSGMALAKLNYGELKIVDENVSLVGFAPDEATAAQVESDMQALPGNYKVTTEIKMPIEGPDFTAGFDITKGLVFKGTTTEDGSAEAVSESLAAPVVSTDMKPNNNGSVEPDLTRLRAIGTYLPRFDTALVTVYGTRVDFVGEATKGAMTDDERAQFASAFDANDSVTINDSIPEANAKRVNILTGVNEYYDEAAQKWLPIVETTQVETQGTDQSAEANECTATSFDMLKNQAINFVTASSQLDPQSNALLDSLATQAQACLATGKLKLEIGGHTDADGTEENNLKLSQARAEAVRAALAARGVDTVNVIAVGYGESNPIADNSTPEGKAKNRRTTFIWLDIN